VIPLSTSLDALLLSDEPLDDEPPDDEPLDDVLPLLVVDGAPGVSELPDEHAAEPRETHPPAKIQPTQSF
jgi:hypothetical protein